jgi:uncharacterized protein (TIGR02145 family)
MKQKLLFSLLTSLLLLSACSSPTESDDNSGESSVGDNTSSEEQNGSSEENKSSFENGNSEEQNNSSSENEGTSSEEGSSSESGSFTSEPNDQDCAYDAGANTLACDEKTYKTVVIGDQVWMAENLNYGAYVEEAGGANYLVEGAKRMCYDDLESECDEYGGLYQWHTALGLDMACGDEVTRCGNLIDESNHQGICPNGWKIPNKDDWDKLALSVGGTVNTRWNEDFDLAGTKLKATSFGGSDDFGFNVLGSGYRLKVGSFGSKGEVSEYWEAGEINAEDVPTRKFSDSNHGLQRFTFDLKRRGHSVRCLKH